MTNCKDCQRDFVKLLLIIFLLRKNKKIQILNIFFFISAPPNLVTDQDIKNPLWQSWELFVV